MTSSRLTSVFVRALCWNYLTSIVLLVAQIAYTAVTARHIPPQDFGAYAVGLTLVQILAYFGGSTIGNAVMRAPRLERESAPTATLLAVVGGLVISVVLVVIAVPVAHVLRAPHLPEVVYLLALLPPATGASAVATGLLRREDRYRAASLIGLVSALLGFLVGGLLAVDGRGVVALVLAQVVTAWIGTLATGVLLRRSIFGAVSVHAVRELVPFAAQVSGQNLLHYVIEALPVWFVTRTAGVSATGYFTRGMQLVALPTYQLVTAIQKSLYPLYYRLDRPQRVRGALTDVLVVTSGGVAVFFGLGAGCGEPLANLILGPGWSSSAALVPLFCAAFAATTIYGVTSSAAEALGWMAVIWRVQVLFVASTVLGLLLSVGRDVRSVVVVMLVAPALAHAAMVTARTFRGHLEGRRVGHAYAVHLVVGLSLYAGPTAVSTALGPESAAADLLARGAVAVALLVLLALLRRRLPVNDVVVRRWGAARGAEPAEVPATASAPITELPDDTAVRI